MKRVFLLIITSITLYGTSNAQQWKAARIEVFGGISLFHYFGDIGGSSTESTLMGLKDINFSKIRPGLNFGARYQIQKQLHIKGTFTTGFITQSDLNSRNAGRNFAFFTFVNELSVTGEFYILPESDENYYYSIMQVRGGLRHFRQPFSLYVSLGMGGVYYNVTPKEDMITSDRFVGDKFLTMSVPFGIGGKYAIMPKVSLGAELIFRYTTTDYLDGYTSVHSNFNDIFYTFNLKVNYKIQQSKKRNIGVPRKNRWFFFF